MPPENKNERPRQPRFSFPNLHDWYAGEAMKAIMINCGDRPCEASQIAKSSFEMADAMLKERENRRRTKQTTSVGSFKV
jgi:hypothetical protein